MTPKAIETRYAGHRFRSRLEARWAVFFDAAGIRWQYEVEGYECGTRLSWSERTIKYLPDFWLPGWGLWAEVKGAWASEDDAKDWLNCVADLSDNYSHRPNFLLLGEVGVAPAQFYMYKGTLSVAPWGVQGVDQTEVASDSNDWPGLATVMAIPGGAPEWPHRIGGKAVDRARSARFEHGESG